MRRPPSTYRSAAGLAGSVVLVTLAGCSPTPRTGLQVPAVRLAATDGSVHALPPAGDGAAYTVLVFSAWHCPCQTAHDGRLGELFARYRTRGVEFFAVDSEVSGSLAEDTAEAKRHGYAFPVLRDEGANLARALHAEYATESFVINRQGVVRYHGGLDSDRNRLRDDAVPLLGNALDDLLAGAPPRSAETKALGCALQTW